MATPSPMNLEQLRTLRDLLPADRRDIGFGLGGIDGRIAELEAQEAGEMSSAVEPQSLDEALDEVQAEKRKEAEETARERNKDPNAPVIAPRPVSRQELYGDLLEQEADLEAQLREAQGKAPNDLMTSIFGQDILPVAQPEKAREIEAKLADIRSQKEYRYAVEVNGLDEYNKLKDLRKRLAEETDETVKDNLEKQIKISEDILQKKGVVVGVAKEGEEVPVQTALPTSRPGTIEPAMTKALANVKRSVESIYMPSIEAEPLIMDEDTATNLIAEIAPIVATGAGGSLAVGKILIALGKTSPKWQYLSSILAPAVGESAFTTTEETATFAEDLFGRGWVESDIEAKKMAIIAESLLVDVALEGVTKTGSAIVNFPYIGGFLKAIPTLLFAGEKQARAKAGERISDLLAEAAGTRGPISPERQIELLAELRAQMSRNFEAQTGVPFDDYLKALEADADSIAKGADPDVIQRSGQAAQLIPEDKFLPLTADLIDEDVLRKVGSGIETGVGTVPFTGARQRQRTAIEEEKERIGETALTPTDEPRTVEEITSEAQQAGESTRIKIKTKLENEMGELNATETKAVEDLEDAVTTLRTELEVSPAVSGVNVPTTQAMDRSADDAANVFFGLFKGADNQRREIYEAYTKQAEAIEIPAEDYREFLEGIGGEQEVGNVIQILINRNPTYGEVLGQLVRQDQAVAGAVAQQAKRRVKGAIEALDKPVKPVKADIVPAKPKKPKKDAPKAEQTAYDKALKEYENKLAQYDNDMEQFKLATAQYERDVLEAGDTARASVSVDEAKEEIGFQDIKLSNVEGLLQAVNAELRFSSGAEQVALQKMSANLEQFIKGKIPEGSELAIARESANSYFQSFQGLYKYIPQESKTFLRYGDSIEAAMDNIQDVELGVMQSAFANMLDAASSDPRVAGQNIRNIRSQLQGEALDKFDTAVNDYFTNKLYGEEISVYVDDLGGETDPRKVAAKADAVARKVAEAVRNPKYRYLEDLAPGVRERILRSAEELRLKGSDLKTKDKAVEQLKKDLKIERKALEERPAAVFAEGTVGGRFGVDAIQAAADMILSKDARQVFEQSWEISGTVGKKGPDGLTQSQRDLKKVMAQGISSLLLTPTDEVRKTVGQVSFAMLGKITRSPAFDKAFPVGDPTRIAVERLAAKAAAIEASQKAGKLTAESITDTLKQSRDLVDGVIRYAKGPLSREGRQASMVARAFFAVVGGSARVNEVLLDMFTNPEVATKILKEQEDILRKGLEDAPSRAYTKALNNYFLQRIGITSMDEFNEEQQAFVQGYLMEEQMGEAFNNQEGAERGD